MGALRGQEAAASVLPVTWHAVAMPRIVSLRVLIVCGTPAVTRLQLVSACAGLAFASPVPRWRPRLLSLAASSQLYFRWLRAKNAADRQQARELFCTGARKFPLPQALMRLCALCSRCLLLSGCLGAGWPSACQGWASACLGFRTGKMRLPSRSPCLPARMSRSNSRQCS